MECKNVLNFLNLMQDMLLSSKLDQTKVILMYIYADKMLNNTCNMLLEAPS